MYFRSFTREFWVLGGLWDFSDSPEAEFSFPFGFDWDWDWNLAWGLSIEENNLFKGQIITQPSHFDSLILLERRW